MALRILQGEFSIVLYMVLPPSDGVTSWVMVPMLLTRLVAGCWIAVHPLPLIARSTTHLLRSAHSSSASLMISSSDLGFGGNWRFNDVRSFI